MTRLWNRFVLWLVSTLFAWFVAIYLGLVRRRKMSHNNGIAGAGKAEVVKDQTFPPHPFFTPGRTFGARVRHAAAGFLDDGMWEVRALSLKFADAPVESPFDIEMNTGRSLFWTVRNFIEFVYLRRNKMGNCYVEWYKKYPDGRAAAQDSVARLPSSYAPLTYTSQTPTLWIGTDGVRRYACYRVVPYGREPERLVNTEQEVKRFEGDQAVFPEEPRDRNYLKREYAQRVKAGPVQYLLQVQTREARLDDNPEIFNSNKPWDPVVAPWHDLAVFTIDRVLPYAEEQMMWFSLNHAPEGLGIIEATGIDDPNSLNYMRSRSDIAKRMRVWALRRRGQWPQAPAEGTRSVDEFDSFEQIYPKGLEAAAEEQRAFESRDVVV